MNTAKMTAALPTYWREASSVILVGRTNQQLKSDSKVLMMKRSEKMSFMPGAFVFPGGTISREDYSMSWRSYIQRFTGRNIESLAQDFQITDVSVRAPMFTLERPWDVPAEIAFRICAARELFEESGIFLAKSQDNLSRLSRNRTGSVMIMDKNVLSKWRSLINKNDSNFLLMCQEMKVLPDIWALHEWSCWLTPIKRKVTKPPPKPKRFDTIFYICCLDGIPHTTQDDDEMVETKWMNAAELVQGGIANRLQVEAPQLLELGKIGNASWSEIVNYSYDRSLKGIQRWLPEIKFCDGGAIIVLPGDDLYPDLNDPEGRKDRDRQLEGTLEELRNRSHSIHRYERSVDGMNYICNIVLPHDYRTPVLKFESSRL